MTEIKLPAGIGESSATVLRWHKKPGDSFDAGAPLIELETEQGTLSVSSEVAGVLKKAIAQPKQTLYPGEAFAQIESDESSPSATSAAPAKSEKEPAVSNDSSSVDVSDVVPILMPQAGNTMEEGTVLEWRVAEGDQIEVGQILCEIETDKATMEFESPNAGRLARIVAQVNEPVPVKELIAVVADDDASADAFLASSGAGQSASSSPAAAASSASATNSAPTQTAAVATPVSHGTNGSVVASPAARKIAADKGLALESVGMGSGPGGRILSTDLGRASAGQAAPVVSDGTALRKPMSKMRRAIGMNLQQSKQTVPHFYVRLTINATPLQQFYREQKPVTSCSMNDLIVLAVGRAMREFPAVRSQIDGNEIVEFPHANIGIAVGVDDGLVVPVVLNVDTLSLADLAKESKRVVEAGRKGSLENIGKGNFTISNLGMFGVEEFSAIINPPESGILAVSAVCETVIVENGSMSPGKVMTMTLSADHRIVDGLLAAKFLARLKEILENPVEELS